MDLKKELSWVLQVLGSKIRDKQVDVIYTPERFPLVYGRGTQIGQVLMNMLHNAVQAVPKGGRIEISTRNQGDAVWIEIKDNGPGIKEDNIKQIFNPFFTTKDPGSGMGLGLSICEQIIRTHGGQLTVKNRDEGGRSLPLVFHGKTEHSPPIP